jgi:hypothetical protein
MVSKARRVELELGQEGFNEIFCINEDNMLVRKKTPKGGVKSGSVCKTRDGKGYYIVSVNNARLKVHRIIWIMRHGDIPDGMQVNHKNLCKTDNSDSNHELVTNATNARRKGVSLRLNASGYLGVSLHKETGKWVANVRVDDRLNYLGIFEDPLEAAKAVYWYKAWLLATYGEEYLYTGPCCTGGV